MQRSALPTATLHARRGSRQQRGALSRCPIGRPKASPLRAAGPRPGTAATSPGGRRHASQLQRHLKWGASAERDRVPLPGRAGLDGRGQGGAEWAEPGAPVQSLGEALPTTRRGGALEEWRICLVARLLLPARVRLGCGEAFTE